MKRIFLFILMLFWGIYAQNRDDVYQASSSFEFSLLSNEDITDSLPFLNNPENGNSTYSYYIGDQYCFEKSPIKDSGEVIITVDSVDKKICISRITESRSNDIIWNGSIVDTIYSWSFYNTQIREWGDFPVFYDIVTKKDIKEENSKRIFRYYWCHDDFNPKILLYEYNVGLVEIWRGKRKELYNSEYHMTSLGDSASFDNSIWQSAFEFATSSENDIIHQYSKIEKKGFSVRKNGVLDFSSNIKKITLFSASGKTLFEGVPASTPKLKSNKMYFIKLIGNNFSITRKISFVK